MRNDEEFMTHIISEMCEYAEKYGLSKDQTIKQVAENILVLTEISTFENFKI